MSTRPIMYDTVSGRYLISGTSIFVAQLQRDFNENGDLSRAPYQGMGLTDDEIDQALAFTFPPARAPHIDPVLVAFDIVCACGEPRHTIVTPPTFETDACICGRAWRIQVDSQPLPVSATSADM